MQNSSKLGKKQKTLKKLNINMYEGVTEAKYQEARSQYINNYTEYHEGGLFSGGKYVYEPTKAEAKWNANYPNGFIDWRGKQKSLNANGEQYLIDKINEIIDFLNSSS